MKRPIILLIFGLICGMPTLAQNPQKPEFECAIFVLNADSNNSDVIDKQTDKLLARFTVNETMEEERIIKFFRLPNSPWFVVASLYTTDESMLSKSGIGSIDTELSFARRRRRNI